MSTTKRNTRRNNGAAPNNRPADTPPPTPANEGAKALGPGPSPSPGPGQEPPSSGPESDQPSPVQPGPPPDQEQGVNFPAAVVMRVPTDQPGQEQVQIVPINGLDPLSIPTLLRLAIRVHEQQLGLNERN